MLFVSKWRILGGYTETKVKSRGTWNGLFFQTQDNIIQSKSLEWGYNQGTVWNIKCIRTRGKQTVFATGWLNTYVKWDNVRIPEADTGEISSGDHLLEKSYNSRSIAAYELGWRRQSMAKNQFEGEGDRYTGNTFNKAIICDFLEVWYKVLWSTTS